jgi:cysteine dioxygenase
MTGSLTDLGKEISNKIDNGYLLRDMNNDLLNYNGIDWLNYECNKEGKYTRKIVYRDNNIDIVIIAWNPHKESGVHNHPDRGCLLRIMRGTLIEKIFSLQKDLECIKEHILSDNMISYQEGKNGIHNIQNATDEIIISIHIYSPPNFKTEFFMEKN